MSADDLTRKSDQLRQNRTTRMSNLDKTEQQLVADVKEYRTKIDAWLDDLEKQSMDDIHKFKALFMDRYESELAVCDKVKTELMELKEKLDVKDEALLFSRIHQGHEQIQEKSNLISAIAGSVINAKADFVPDARLSELVESLHGLGQLLTDTKVDYPTQKEVTQVTAARGRGRDSNLAQVNQPYTVRRIYSFNVKIEEDERTCGICDMCQLTDGSIIAADNNNSRLKQLDGGCKILRHCLLTGYPLSICHTEADQVAVGMFNKTIQFVSVGRTMTTTCSFSTDHFCYGLAYSKKCLYATESYSSAVHVYNLSGTHLHIISTDQQGRQLFSNTRRVTVSPDGARLHVTDKNGLVTVDTRSNLRTTFSSPELVNGGWAVCVDGGGSVFVGSNSSKHALQVGRMGDSKVAEIISPSDGIDKSSLCFDVVNSRLLTAGSYSDTIHVLHLSNYTTPPHSP